MKVSMKLALTPVFSGTSLITVAHATDLRVAPVVLEPLPDMRRAMLTIQNCGQKPVSVQVSVVRWTQINGDEKLEPTTDVFVSPSQIKLAPGQNDPIRVVHMAKSAISAEESYRVLIDEAPAPADMSAGAVAMLVRQSIPLFFSDESDRVASVDWSIARRGDQAEIVAHNHGTRRLRLSDIVIEAETGPVFEQAGLVGYVLAGCTMRFPVDLGATSLTDPTLRLRGLADTQKLEAPLVNAPPP